MARSSHGNLLVHSSHALAKTRSKKELARSSGTSKAPAFWWLRGDALNPKHRGVREGEPVFSTLPIILTQLRIERLIESSMLLISFLISGLFGIFCLSVSINGANIILGVVGVAVAAMSFMCVLGFCRRAFVSHKIVIDKAAVTCSKKMFREVTLWCEPLPAYTGIRIFEQRGDQVLKTIFLCHASKNRTVPLFTCIDEQKALIVLQQAQAALNVPILPSVAI